VNAMRKKARDRANEWFDQSFATRLDDKRKGVIVLVMQRLHTEDLTGHLLGKGGFTLLSLPAIAREAVVHEFGGLKIKRKVGDLLHGDREDGELLKQAKIELGQQAFEAQYQQEPLPDGGALFKRAWVQYVAMDTLWPYKRVIQSWDTAIKARSTHDASVCVTIGETPDRFHVLDVLVLREEYPSLKRMVLAHEAQWKPDAILIEDKASGQMLLQELNRETDLPFIGVTPHKDKVTRAAVVTALFESGKVVWDRKAMWREAFEAELMAFPHGKHDDQVDALVQGLQWLRQKRISRPTMRLV
jgi:predicted phage terminase large subunit-like protein